MELWFYVSMLVVLLVVFFVGDYKVKKQREEFIRELDDLHKQLIENIDKKIAE